MGNCFQKSPSKIKRGATDKTETLSVAGEGSDLDSNPPSLGPRSNRSSISVDLEQTVRRISTFFKFSNAETTYQRESNRQLACAVTTTPLPLRFYYSEDGNWEKAMERWRDTFRWRAQKNADLALKEPHPDFDVLKKFYPHYYYGRDKRGNMCYWFIPGKMNLTALKAHGVDEERFLWHVMWCLEYCWQELNKKETDRVTVILDMAGLKMSDIVGEVMSIVKKSIKMMGTHYPERSFQIMVINVPSWFNWVFSMIKPMLRKKTQDKIKVIGKRQVQSNLKESIPEDQLPVEYGGKCIKQFLESPEEVAMRAHAVHVVEEEYEQEMMGIQPGFA
mmetsp:Transcript_19816/g.26133  ORF Transcript_19816/g.26133 Transcript_19816/m.26133 type:complete len:333 (-) Transcript_19816:513-1511(-)|eukprot:CAMPEP_0117753546 /NCGR_PEP_ID=MMETSP0947-20121206/12293_1 /TAXON_ID=44440 /ORGANISM="Chattonella subsalsa, Strain CCMP2191" /LENGTH=332 /DNA_ID=CAMNT_0005572455 /DNA_START=185 /DNA_END=1183 /DNA_ORIENTATION=-